jgi:prevent-host-death family protein
MQEIGAFEAKNTLGSLLDRVESGEEIVITRHGKRVARLVPNKVSDANKKAALEALDRMRIAAGELKLGPFDWEIYKKDRDEGRP